MRDRENLQEVCALAPDFVGFIFYPPSKRFVGEDFDPVICHSVPKNIQKVGVFVNASEEIILEKTEKYDLDFLQLHGEESPEFCANLKEKGLKLIKVFSIGEKFDFQILNPYLSCVEYFLFDTPTAAYGGSGKKFDWNLLKNYTFEKPFLLSGGIGEEDAETIQKIDFPTLYGLDLNSRFELSPAYKEVSKLGQFMKRFHKL